MAVFSNSIDTELMPNRFRKLLLERSWLQSFRPLPECFGKERFYRPRNLEEASTRLELNVQYFATNYCLLLLVLLLVVLFTSPWLLLFLVFDGFLWAHVMSKEEIAIGSYKLKGQRNKLICMGALTAFFTVLLAGSSLVTVIGLFAISVMLHAVLHESMIDDSQLESIAPMTGAVSDLDLELDADTEGVV